LSEKVLTDKYIQQNTQGDDSSFTSGVITGVLHIHIKSQSFRQAKGATDFPSPERSLTSILEEAVGLARAIHLNVVHQQIIQLARQTPGTLLGKGNVELIAGIIASLGISLIIINHALSAIQQRNLEMAFKCKVIDRTGLIIEIFGSRARTSEGLQQVELAALNYQRSRLVRSWTHLERQRGGFGFIGGPGESQLELDRRLIDERIIKIKKSLAQTKRTRSLHRSARQRVPYPIVALAGYTNAGKSTLFNLLTQANVLVQDQLFATLDPTMRHVKLPDGRQIILSDTVGFIADLPTQLIAAFRATLEDVLSADLILHVRDCAHQETKAQSQDVYKVLYELGIENPLEKGILLEVHNKKDLLSAHDLEIFDNRLKRESSAVAVSALTGEGIKELLMRISQELNQKGVLRNITIPASSGEMLAWCYRQGVIVHRHDDEENIHLILRLTPSQRAQIDSQFGGLAGNID
jgi:GTP-binding protein HflX